MTVSVESYKDLIPDKIIICNDISLSKNYMKYIYLLLIVLVVFVIYCYYLYFTKMTNDVEILQTDYGEDIAQDVLSEKKVAVFRDVLFDWECVCEIFDMSIEDINKLTKESKVFNKVLKDYLSPFSLPLTYDWDYNITYRTKSDNQHHFILEEQHRHLIAQITGEQRIYVAAPEQIKNIKPLMVYSKKNTKNMKTVKSKDYEINKTFSTTDFWSQEETSKEPYTKLEYMEIVLRAGNMMYIPYGWWYLQQVKEDCLVLEASCKSVFTLIF